MAFSIVAVLGFAFRAPAQRLRFSNEYREVAIPEYATVKLGPFYSAVTFEQIVGYRYTWSMRERIETRDLGFQGRIREDGGEFPLISALLSRNYLLINPYTDLDASFRMAYAHYPLDTQEDEFVFMMADGEEIYADLNGEIRLTPFIRGRLRLRPAYRSDYIDLRGFEDEWGGTEYERFESLISLDLDWLIARDKAAGLNLAREDVYPRDKEFEDQRRTTHSGSVFYEHEVNNFLVVGARAGAYDTRYHGTDREDVSGTTYSLYLRGGRGDLLEDEHGLVVKITDYTRFQASIGYSAAAAVAETVQDTDAGPRRGGSTDVTGTVIGDAWIETLLAKNLRHKVEFRRWQRSGFRGGIETVDRWSYEIKADGDAFMLGPVAVRVRSDLTTAAPELSVRNGYTDWTTALRAEYPLTRYIVLNLDSWYSDRKNETLAADLIGDEEPDPELVYDYQTWTSRLSTSFLVTKSVTARLYGEHSRRTSRANELDYERGVVGADLKFVHHF